MYKIAKNIFRILIPNKVFFKSEYFLRQILCLFYIGKTYRCNICLKKLRVFLLVDNEKICPCCGSLSRNRRLWKLFNDSFRRNNLSILDFSPSRNLYHQFKKGNFSYTASDLSKDFISDVKFDITQIDAENQSYDLIICYHILEHVIEDTKAMKELYRVLKHNGTCIIQTPFTNGDIYEDYSIVSDKERTIHFGQKDHVRIYSVDELKNRLEKVGFKVTVKKFIDDDSNYFGFKSDENVLIGTK